jgi:hypothetical protein
MATDSTASWRRVGRPSEEDAAIRSCAAVVVLEGERNAARSDFSFNDPMNIELGTLCPIYSTIFNASSHLFLRPA